MIRIKNRTESMLQLMVRSRKKNRSFTTLVLPGKGSKNHIKEIPDEWYTDQIGVLKAKKLIDVEITDD